ncbi:uncharacterized protein Dwil_GK13671 [Drosophila willistoni]|uniref:Uncharacterized protein n=1 Tax=Drosophila willistoni TaxID=7260 RepID=B4N401_DROWI|nr:G2/mitotic-specific cyclin-A [Drosophila willistoni]EDW79356.1 uncharacterized protein Dwil_GK13671 [Drosophila willistoni]
MASFQIHRDITNEKENSAALVTLKEKSVMSSKQPLGVIKEKQMLAPREHFGVLSSNNNNQQARGIPAPGGKAVLREVGPTKSSDENVIYAAVGGSKKSSVVDQFKNFTVYEDNYDTQVTIAPPKQTVAAAPAVSSIIDKENQIIDNVKEYGNQQEYDLDGTPMSVTDVLSPMSLDRSIGGVQSIDEDAHKDVTGQQLLTARELPPRNDRQRFFEVTQYQTDILRYFQESEKKHRPKAQYMRRQRDINHNMRSILIDWLVEVSEEYKLDTETLYLSVSYLDRFLSQMAVVRSKLQLVGTAAMYIAAKYEEIYPPAVGEFVFLTDDSYTKVQVLRMEQVILKVLSFDLCTPTAYVFVNTYAVLSDMPERLKYLTLFLCELSLMEGDPYLQYLPSLISSAALALARHMLGMDIWSQKLEEITTYKLADLKTVMLQLCQTHNNSKELNTQAIREKYNREKYKKVTAIESIELTKEQLDKLCVAYQMEQQQLQEASVSSSSSATTITSLPPPNNPQTKANLFYKF